MPCAMAVQRPHPRIVGIELNYYVARSQRRIRLSHHVCVPPRRVGNIGGDSPIPVTITFSQDEEIMSVEMHGMSGVGRIDVVTEDDTDRVIIAKVVDVPLRVVGIGGISLVGEQEERMARTKSQTTLEIAYEIHRSRTPRGWRKSMCRAEFSKQKQ